MSTATETIEGLVKQEYKYGFYTDVETESAPPGLSEDTIRLISRRKNEPAWLTDWRLKAFRHWLTLEEPAWPKVHHEKINYQDIIYFSAPKQKKDAPKSLAVRCTNAGGSPAWPWTRCLIPCPSAPRSKSSSPKRASSSARSARRCWNIPTW
jgi:hypothetical protein